MMKQILQPPVTYKSLDVFKSKDFWDDFFFRIGNGESLRGAAKVLGVPFQTVWSSIMIDEGRRAIYEDAKISRAHYHAAKIEEILEELEAGRIEPQVARVSIDARKWLAAKMYPKFFSDKFQLQHDVTVDVRKQHIEELRRMSRERQEKQTLTVEESHV